eukprot:Amastigsp_a181275_21.p3 type:complete len:184 gc:universal Amastigsp_a181275_21:1243-692(-)
MATHHCAPLRLRSRPWTGSSPPQRTLTCSDSPLPLQARSLSTLTRATPSSGRRTSDSRPRSRTASRTPSSRGARPLRRLSSRPRRPSRCSLARPTASASTASAQPSPSPTTATTSTALWAHTLSRTLGPRSPPPLSSALVTSRTPSRPTSTPISSDSSTAPSPWHPRQLSLSPARVASLAPSP